ncbi:MAG: redox-regulated ATPase YchF [Sedimentisphaerales bacterium]|nr:redox-regulated ATPase YchF [Sedimentisphaerales bacterium]
MQAALIGLTQSGKSTLFSAVTEGHTHAGAAIGHQTDKAVVKVPDDRLAVLTEVYQPKKTTHATIEFLDLPGLSFLDEAHRQEARRIVAQARQADMLVWVVRAFNNPQAAAYRDRINPPADYDELNTELLLADLELIANRIDKLQKSITKPTPHVQQDKVELALLQRCHEAVENERPIRSVIASPEEEKLLRSFGFLTLKPRAVVVNVGEDAIGQPAALTAEQTGCDTLALSAEIEAEIAALDPADRAAFMEDMHLADSAKDRLIRICYHAMRLISFLTVGPDEVRAWTIPADCPAVEAAGAVHSDIQRGFIRAETVHYDDFLAAGKDMKAAKAAGKVRLEGKTYPVRDGDIINFRFNV